VLRAIYLYNQTRGGCIEVSDVVADWFLAVELYAVDFAFDAIEPTGAAFIS
jgi:hypothetical protein